VAQGGARPSSQGPRPLRTLGRGARGVPAGAVGRGRSGRMVRIRWRPLRRSSKRHARRPRHRPPRRTTAAQLQQGAHRPPRGHRAPEQLDGSRPRTSAAAPRPGTTPQGRDASWEPYGDWRDLEVRALGQLRAAIGEHRSTGQACRSCGRSVSDEAWRAICEIAGVDYRADVGWRRCGRCIGQARKADGDTRRRAPTPLARPPLGIRLNP
jgi:hypothetical protein